jgi:hypothetical protein
MKLIHIIQLMAIGFVAIACIKRPEYPIEPVIQYEGLNKRTIAQGSSSALPDTLNLRFSFTDGDGDLGYENDSLDIFLTDSRDGFIENLKLPVFPSQGTGIGISGEITVRIFNKPFNICCTFPNGQVPCTPSTVFPIDTFSYGIQIRDRAGHFSNKVQSEVITVLCN